MREPTAPPTPLGLPTLQPPPLPSPLGTPNGQVQPISRNGGRDRPEDRQLDWPQARPTSKEVAHGAPAQPLAPGWKAPARPGLVQRKESPPAAWEQEQSHNKGLSPEQAPPQATVTVGVEAARPWAAKFRPLQTIRAPRAKGGAVASEEGQGRKAGGWEARRRGLKPRKPLKGEDQPGQAVPKWSLWG